MSFELDRLLVGSVPMACTNLANHLQQCAESDAHAKSFYEFLPRLCQIFFGSRESRGWLHLPLSKAEADHLFDVLKPGGPLFRFLVNRSTDTGFIYEMNPESLPKSTQSKLDPAHYTSLPPIYLSRVSLVKTTTTIDAQKTMALVSKVNINFNMLEYFLFYFAYALTLDDDEDNNRMLKRPEPKMTFRIQGLVPSTPAPSGGYQQPNWNARATPKPVFPRLVHGPYFNLYEEYLKYFLPEPEKSGTSQQSKEKPFSIFTDPSIENSANRQQTQLAITEFFIGTTVELWLGQNDSNVNNMTIRYVQPGTSLTACINDLVSQLISYDISQYRLGGEVAPTHVAALARRSAYQVVRPKLYTFVRAGLKFWPLDETFPRLVDLWVTWITPWYYGRRDSLLGKDAIVVKEQWQPYVFENLLFYTTLLQLFLPRLSQPTQTNRSLTTPAPMPPTRELRQLRKVLNVYKAEHLKQILKVAEQVVLSPERFTESTFHMFDSETGRDATSAFLSSMAVTMPTLVYQLEGPDFRYQALFLVEGLGRTAVRQILTKLGNEVNARQGKLAAIQAKNKPSATQNSIFDKLSAMFESSAPKIASSKEIDTLTSESMNLRETMKDVGNVFDLFQEFVESFERKQESSQEGGSALSAEQIDALIAPVEEELGSSLFSSVRQRRYTPQGLVKKSIDDVPVQGSRESIILSYENEQLVTWSIQAEAYLSERLPFKVALRWLASYHNLACLGVVILAFVVMSMLMSFWSNLGNSHLQPQQPHISKSAQTQDHNIVGHYDAHVQPVYKWEKPGQYKRHSSRRYIFSAIVIALFMSLIGIGAQKLELATSWVELLLVVALVIFMVYVVVKVSIVIRWCFYWLVLATLILFAMNHGSLFKTITSAPTENRISLGGKIVLIVLALLEGCTLGLVALKRIAYPRIVLRATWLNSKWWWRIREAPLPMSHTQNYKSVVFSYLSWDPDEYRLTRSTVTYVGEFDEEGQPHGLGEWTDHTFTGEAIQGIWEHGIPIGPFKSQEYGTGNAFSSIRIGYCKNSMDKDGSTVFNAARDINGPSYGAAAVECSVSGKFFHHLPYVRILGQGTLRSELEKSAKDDMELSTNPLSYPLSFLSTFTESLQSRPSIRGSFRGLTPRNAPLSKSVVVRYTDRGIFIPGYIRSRKSSDPNEVRIRRVCPPSQGVEGQHLATPMFGTQEASESSQHPTTPTLVLPNSNISAASSDSDLDLDSTNVKRLSISESVDQESSRHPRSEKHRKGRSEQPGLVVDGWRQVLDIGGNSSSAVQASRAGYEALVFIHGYNCPLTYGIARLGQLLSLGEFPPYIKPFVFSWPSSTTMGYFTAKSVGCSDSVGNDLLRFIEDLHESGFQRVHILAHSMGARIVLSAFRKGCFEGTFAERDTTNLEPSFISTSGSDSNLRGKSFIRHTNSQTKYAEPHDGDSLPGDRPGRIQLASFTLLNPDADLSVFLEEDYWTLTRYCSHITLYADAHDGALFWSEVLGRQDSLGRHPRTLVYTPTGEVLDVDVIDTTSLDVNIHSIRHNFFNLNRMLVDDLYDVIVLGRRAREREGRLSSRWTFSPNGVANGEVYTFLCAPSYVVNK
ncbi:hypothetical protein BGZ81_009685 [Podila clonocystis]|nr:hypothetical protein BGZ81_009685 [Podila clonocystis]